MESFFQGVKICGEHCENCLAFQNGRQTNNERKCAVHFQIWSFTYIAGYLSCRMTDIEGFLTICGHSDNLLNNNKIYYILLTFRQCFKRLFLRFAQFGGQALVLLMCYIHNESHSLLLTLLKGATSRITHLEKTGKLFQVCHS